MNNDTPIERIMSEAMSKMRTLVDVNTVVGTPVEANGNTIIPLSKVSMGFVAGGGEYSDTAKKPKSNTEYPFAGGSGGGICVAPIGFLVFKNDNVKIVCIDDKSAFEKLLETMPSVVHSVMKNINKDNDQ